ncbi:hypothetical protein LTR65_010507 [Meristemomyces frigidus]
MASFALLLGMAALVSVNGAATISQRIITTALGAASYSYTYTVTTPTTAWHPPTFSTAAPVPACSESMCPAMSGKTCTDTGGVTYGILCATRFSGIVITNSGKKFLLERDEDFEQIEAEMRGGREKRDYTGTFDNCAGFCDTYDKAVSRSRNVPLTMTDR